MTIKQVRDSVINLLEFLFPFAKNKMTYEFDHMPDHKKRSRLEELHEEYARREKLHSEPED